MTLAHFFIALAVAAAMIGSVVLSRLTDLPPPIFLVPAGVAVSFVPGLPDVLIGPDVIFYGFLPPLLYSAAFFASPREWRANWQPITGLALGLVLATVFVVAGVTSAAIAGLGVGSAFVLGAVVGPTDPVAATAVIGRLGAPQRLRTILEGESLVNDGVALVIFSIAVSAALSQSFSVVHGLLRFLEVAAGGIAIGIVLGWLVVHVRSRIEEPMVEILISLLTPYVAFITADEASVSGVLATVTTGAFLGLRSAGLFQPHVRVQAYAFWNVLTFLLESSLFVLLGAQFPAVISDLGGYSGWQLTAYGLLVFGAVASLRLAWQFTVPHLTHALDMRFRELRSPTPWRERLVLGWGGMRGAITLAAALSIPLAMTGRGLLIFLAFSVILGTVLVQGVTLPYLIRALGLARGEESSRRELEARIKLAEAALNRLDELAAEEDVDVSQVEPLRQIYEERIERHSAELDEDSDGHDGSVSFEEVHRELLGAQRSMLRRLSREGALEQETGRRLQRELDLDEARFAER